MKILIPSLLTVLVATNAFSYTTKEECEKVEKLDCKECGGGWHRPAACPPSLLAYSGTLSMADKAVDGLYDVAFHLYHDPVGGVPAAMSSTNLSLTVVNGHVDAQIDTWGSDDLAAENLYVEVAVRPTGSDQPFATLSPRQAISIVPKASFAKIAETVSPTAFRDFPQEGMDGAIIARATLTGDKLAPGQVVKSLNGLTEAVTLKGGNGISILTGPNNTLTLEKNIQAFNCTDYENCYWSLTGNVNIMPGVNFLGGGINELDPVEFRVNNTHALRLQRSSTAGGTPNIIGGHKNNTVPAAILAATIGGGGNQFSPNTVNAHYGTVSGGVGNSANGVQAAIGGGVLNLGGGASSTIAGGIRNTATQDATTISGGASNLVSATFGTITGGNNNTNRARAAFIGGGSTNAIGLSATAATLAGGQGNLIQDGAPFATLGGGEGNTIRAKSPHGTLGGGKGNIIYDAALFASLVGGEGNVVGDNTTHGSILGGLQNAVFGSTHGATIAGGRGNKVESDYTAIAGGMENDAIGNASFVGGGIKNVSNGAHATVAGGGFNEALANGATVGGGSGNHATGDHSTIPGGEGNRVAGNGGTAGGGTGNLVTLPGGTISGGDNNKAIGSSATIGGGSRNTASGTASSIGGGSQNTASGTSSTIPGGMRAVASNYGQQAYASGQFNAAGDAQSSLFVVRNTTSPTTPTAFLFLDGSGQSMTLPPNTTWTFKATVVARTAGGTLSAGWEITGVVNRIGTAAPTLSCVLPTYSCPQLGWAVTAVVVGSDLRIQATGPSNLTIGWVASVRTSEVTF